MSYKTNIKIQKPLFQVIKSLLTLCLEKCNTILENAFKEDIKISPENMDEKGLCYKKRLRRALGKSNMAITQDGNRNTSQYSLNLQNKSSQFEIIPFVKSNTHEVNSHINRLKILIKMARSIKIQLIKLQKNKNKARPKHIDKAKYRFTLVKKEMWDLIKYLFPEYPKKMFAIIGNLLYTSIFGKSNGYIKVTLAFYKVVELLIDMNIVIVNPEDSTEVKLAFLK